MSEIVFFLSPLPLLFPFPNFCLLCSPHIHSRNPRPVPASTPPSALSRSLLVVTVVCTGVPPICIGILTSDLGAQAAVLARRCQGTGKEAGRGRDTKMYTSFLSVWRAGKGEPASSRCWIPFTSTNYAPQQKHHQHLTSY